jgi:hypothetical protein
MDIKLIGQNAGKIWQNLDSEGETSLSELIKKTKLDTNNFFMALGWLAREKKIFFYKNSNGELFITLIY